MKRAVALLLIAFAASAAPVDPSKIAPDIEQRLAKFKRVDMPFTMEGFSASEKTLVQIGRRTPQLASTRCLPTQAIPSLRWTPSSEQRRLD